MFFVAALVGCGQVPAEVKFTGEPTVTVHTMDPVAVQAATVLDAEGKALEAQPELKWSVSPEGIVKLDGDKVVPEKAGQAMVKACATDTVCKEYTFVVAPPDSVVLSGAEGVNWAVGATNPLTAKVMAGTAEVPGQTVTWTSDNAAVATVNEKGEVTGVTAGTATITATSGTLTATVPLTIVDAAAAPAPGVN